MSKPVLARELGIRLVDALGLPKGTKWFELRCGVDEIVTVKCAYYPEKLNQDEVELVLKEYELTEKVQP